MGCAELFLAMGRLRRVRRKSLNGECNDTVEGMKFLLEVDMGETAFDGDAARELGRILRYWGGNLQHFALTPGDGAAIHDSRYEEVGRWKITEAD